MTEAEIKLIKIRKAYNLWDGGLESTDNFVKVLRAELPLLKTEREIIEEARKWANDRLGKFGRLEALIVILDQ